MSANEVYRISHKMPNWMRAALAHEGIPVEFSLEELTDDQKSTIVVLTEVYKLVEAGILKVTFDPKKDSAPQFSLTEKALKEFAERMEAEE